MSQDDYAAIADLYDHVVPYRTRADIRFFVKLRENPAGRSWRSHKDGRLILDLFNPWLHAIVSDDLGREVGEEPEFIAPDGRRVVRCHRILARDHFQQIAHVELLYDITHVDGSKERLVHAFQMRHLYRFEAEHLLARCGFDVENVYADFDNSGYGSKYPGELIFIAKRNS